MQPAVAYIRVSHRARAAMASAWRRSRPPLSSLARRRATTFPRPSAKWRPVRALERLPKLAADQGGAPAGQDRQYSQRGIMAAALIIVAKLDEPRCGVHQRPYGAESPFIVTERGPGVGPFMLHIYAAVAEKQRSHIAERTRAALAAAKARGQQLGDPAIGRRNRQGFRRLCREPARDRDAAGPADDASDCQGTQRPRHQDCARRPVAVVAGDAAAARPARAVTRPWVDSALWRGAIP